MIGPKFLVGDVLKLLEPVARTACNSIKKKTTALELLLILTAELAFCHDKSLTMTQVMKSFAKTYAGNLVDQSHRSIDTGTVQSKGK